MVSSAERLFLRGPCLRDTCTIYARRRLFKSRLALPFPDEEIGGRDARWGGGHTQKRIRKKPSAWSGRGTTTLGSSLLGMPNAVHKRSLSPTGALKCLSPSLACVVVCTNPLPFPSTTYYSTTTYVPIQRWKMPVAT